VGPVLRCPTSFRLKSLRLVEPVLGIALDWSWRFECLDTPFARLRCIYFMFCSPSISIHLCNENQIDELFILGLFRKSASICFGSSTAANRHSTKKHNTYQLLCIYSIPPDDGLQICPKHVEVDGRNELKINIVASSWFSLQRFAALGKLVNQEREQVATPNELWRSHLDNSTCAPENRGRMCIASAEGRFELPATRTRTLRQNLRQT
jgi:hypothetical protein